MDFCFENIKVAWADIPESFETTANIVYRWQHDLVPFTHFLQASDKRDNIMLYSSGRELYEDYVNDYERNIISSDPDTISDGIMDSWHMKSASEDRISRNFSEAIRGVNSYTDVNGRSFEFSNQADHVYTDQYGDHVGVSGNSPDENTKRRFNLKEVFKR